MEKIKFDGYSVNQRGNSWQIYISKELTGQVIRKSLNTYDRTTALQRAREIYSDLLAEYDNSGFGKDSFKANAQDFIALTNNPQHKEYMERCFIPYFSETIANKSKIRDINKLTSLDMIKYVEYRRKLVFGKVLYSYRHSYISALVQSKTDTINIAKQCGTSVKMIEDYYDKFSHLANMSQLFIQTSDEPVRL